MDAVRRGGPVEERLDGLAGKALAPVRQLDAIPHLEPALVVRWPMEPDGADRVALPRRVGEHDEAAEPLAGPRLGIEVGQPVAEEVDEVVREAVGDGRAGDPARGL